MSSDDWHTLRVPPEAYDAAKAQKENAGRTWGEQIVRPTDEDDDELADLERTIEKLCRRYARLNEEVSRVIQDDESDDDDTAQRIIGRIDDLETELTTQHERLGR